MASSPPPSSWIWMKGIKESINLSNPIDPVTEHDQRPAVKDLIEQHRARIDKVAAGITDDPLFEPTKHDDLWILRFCLSHKKSKNAIAAAKSTLEFRAKHKLDDKDIRFVPPHKVTEGVAGLHAKLITPGCIRFTIPDTNRGVVAFFKTSTINFNELMEKIARSDWFQVFLYFSEWTHQWVDRVTRTTGRLTKTVRIFDISDMGLTTMPMEAIRRDSDAAAMMEDVFPQLLETIYLCFPGPVFNISWRIARPLLPSRVVSKMDVLNPIKHEKERQRFEKHMAAAAVPIEFGGPNGSYRDWKEETEAGQQH